MTKKMPQAKLFIKHHERLKCDGNNGAATFGRNQNFKKEAGGVAEPPA